MRPPLGGGPQYKRHHGACPEDSHESGQPDPSSDPVRSRHLLLVSWVVEQDREGKRAVAVLREVGGRRVDGREVRGRIVRGEKNRSEEHTSELQSLRHL